MLWRPLLGLPSRPFVSGMVMGLLYDECGWIMKVKEYEEFVVSNAKQPLDMDNGVYNFIGLAGETGECMEWLKKSHFRGNQAFTDDHLFKEIGDVLHYVTRIALWKGWTLKQVMEGNVLKLRERNAKS